MDNETELKQQVREFYDQVGWKEVADGVYQNARYEDLRPVAHEYIQYCHQRVQRHLESRGRYLLDAGSGPIQYPEYLEYSQGYEYRVCLDISITALQEAHKRIGEHGLFVVGDIAHLPFKADAFDGAVSLHTIHHLPAEEHIPAYRDIHRVLKPERRAILVNGWDNPPLVRLLNFPRLTYRRLRGEGKTKKQKRQKKLAENKGTYVRKSNAAWLEQELKPYMPLDILVWRSLNVQALRFYIRPRLGGRFWLKILYRLEEVFPRFFGRYGAYPLVVIQKESD